jgi:hypothetical protein
MQGVRANLLGQRFGNLLVVGPASSDQPGQHWSCVCDCGQACVKAGKELTKPSKRLWTHSCGCRPALTKSIYKRVRDQIDPRLDFLHEEQRKR